MPQKGNDSLPQNQDDELETPVDEPPPVPIQDPPANEPKTPYTVTGGDIVDDVADL